jgi:hypothetical protein
MLRRLAPLRRRLRPPSLPVAISLLALSIAVTGTAVAAAPQLFAIADKTGVNVAKVNTSGQLSTAGTVSGSVGMAVPSKPFNFAAISFQDNFATAQFAPTTATVALTGFRVANGVSVPTSVSYFQYDETSTSCSETATRRFLGQFVVPASDTVVEQLNTPIVLKPLVTGHSWCIITYASGNGGSGFWTTYNGFTTSGTFAAASSLKLGATRKDVERAFGGRR